MSAKVRKMDKLFRRLRAWLCQRKCAHQTGGESHIYWFTLGRGQCMQCLKEFQKA